MYYGKKYIIEEKDKILIYGAATTGAIIYKKLIGLSYNVIAFVDRRSNEIESYYNLPVWSIDDVKQNCQENDQIIVIIAIKNVFEHERVAKMLWETGCKRIIFRPYNELNGKGTEEDKELNKLYNKVMEGEMPLGGYIIKGYEEHILKDNAIMEENDDYVIANIPIYYIFTDKYENVDIIWGDIPCIGLIPHIGLFNLFAGKYNDDYKEYIKFCREAAIRSGGVTASESWEDNVYSSRLDVFNHMEYLWEHDRNFFIRNAVEADYNEKGYFNIKSGKHRIVYMMIKGKRYIPLKILKADYRKWNVRDKAEKINKLLISQNKDILNVRLGNPFFYDYPYQATKFYEDILIRIIELVFRKEYYLNGKFFLGDKKILFWNSPCAVYANVFIMMGFKVFVIEETENAMLLNDVMLGNNYCKIKAEQALEMSYYLAIVDNEADGLNLDADTRFYVTKEKIDQEILVSGMVNGEILFAYKEI